MTYGCEAMIPVKIGQTSWRRLRTLEKGEEENNKALATELDLVDEVRITAHCRDIAAKQLVVAKYNRKVEPKVSNKSRFAQELISIILFTIAVGLVWFMGLLRSKIHWKLRWDWNFRCWFKFFIFPKDLNKEVMREKNVKTFKDVKGCDDAKQELEEVVEYLKIHLNLHALEESCLRDQGKECKRETHRLRTTRLEEDEDEVGWIVSFDIAMEVFALIPMPPSLFSITNTPYPRYHLTAHENKLALLSHTLSGDSKSSLIHLWVMEEGTCASGERWVWTKKYISSPYLGYLLVPVAIWRNEIVCIVEPIDKIEDDERKLVLLNLTTNEFKASDIHKPVIVDGIFNYTEPRTAWLPWMRGSFPSSAMTDMDMDGSNQTNALLPHDIITHIFIRLPIVKISAQKYDGRVNEVKVYSLSIGSWKDVQFGNLDGVGIITTNGFSFNGAIFWIGYKIGLEEDEDEVGWIVSFDIAMEVFALIPMPSSLVSVTYTPYPRSRYHLTAHENKLALLSHTLSGDLKSSMIHLWVMEEGTCGSRERLIWTKKYISSPYLGYFLLPVAIWRNEIVCIVASPLSDTIDKIEDDERKPVLLNLTTNEFKSSDICKAVLGYGIFNYSESLVPVGNIHTE
ncbi:hypothetical protein K1719_025800 [Acacia pycnantha]|nr:hypothetical protein K1719_025800 [Acacia pycnantha]